MYLSDEELVKSSSHYSKVKMEVAKVVQSVVSVLMKQEVNATGKIQPDSSGRIPASWQDDVQCLDVLPSHHHRCISS